MGNFAKVRKHIMPFSEKKKREFLPYGVLKLLTGGEILENYQNKNEIVAIKWNDQIDPYHLEDFTLMKMIADRIWNEQVQERNLIPSLYSLPTSLELLSLAQNMIGKVLDHIYGDKKSLIYIKDRSGCGYWRMYLPACYMDIDKYYIDIAETEVSYNMLLDYDVIFVQRLHSWGEYYTLERLKRHGKRIVYDIDDDIFSIPPDNPASRLIQDDEKAAAKAIMGLVDTITTTTEVLKDQLGYPEKTEVIPNSIDLSEYKIELNYSNDEFYRILWMGSSTHEQDWHECIDAIENILMNYSQVRLTLIGFVPRIMQEKYSNDKSGIWNNRIEFRNFSNVESYIHNLKSIKADVAIAPLQETKFNKSKSSLKFIEYTKVGIPVIASNVSPYKEVIKDGVNGYLANNNGEWYQLLSMFIDGNIDCKSILNNAIETVECSFDIKKNIELWEKILLNGL